MPKMVDTYFQRIAKMSKKEEEREASKKQLVAQAREYYGYEVNLKDPRMVEYLEKMKIQDKADKKAEKKAAKK
jgi:hypothetical protein